MKGAHVLSRTHLNNRQLLALLSNVFVVRDGSVAVLRHVRHFKIRVNTGLQRERARIRFKSWMRS